MQSTRLRSESGGGDGEGWSGSYWAPERWMVQAGGGHEWCIDQTAGSVSSEG
jgi:hypothetical protein